MIFKLLFDEIFGKVIRFCRMFMVFFRFVMFYVFIKSL